LYSALDYRSASHSCLLRRFHHFDFHSRNPTAHHSQHAGGACGQVNESIAHIGAAVINADDYGAAVVEISDHDSSSEWQIAVGCGQIILVETLATGAEVAIKSRAVPGSPATEAHLNWAQRQQGGFWLGFACDLFQGWGVAQKPAEAIGCLQGVSAKVIGGVGEDGFGVDVYQVLAVCLDNVAIAFFPLNGNAVGIDVVAG